MHTPRAKGKQKRRTGHQPPVPIDETVERVVVVNPETDRARMEQQAAAIAQAHAHASSFLEPMLRSVVEMERYVRSMVPMTRVLEQTARTLRLIEYARVYAHIDRIMQKMHRSKGVLAGLKAAEQVCFVPEAALAYGFGHVPSEDDPEGSLHKKLPSSPGPALLDHGVYLFSPRKEEPSEPKRDEDLDYVEARRVYEKSGGKGVSPYDVYRTLRMAPIFDRLWLELDLESDIDRQVEQFKEWLGHARLEIYEHPRNRLYEKREVGRDTLIFTLKESGGLTAKEIASRVFRKERSQESLGDPEAKVRQILKRTRAALKAVGFLDVPKSRV